MYAFLFFEKSFFDASCCLKSPPVADKNIQSCVGEMAGRDPDVGKVGVYLVLCMVVPGGDACDRLVCVCDTLGCALDVGGGGEGCVFSCLPFCHALFLGGFHWFCAASLA